MNKGRRGPFHRITRQYRARDVMQTVRSSEIKKSVKACRCCRVEMLEATGCRVQGAGWGTPCSTILTLLAENHLTPCPDYQLSKVTNQRKSVPRSLIQTFSISNVESGIVFIATGRKYVFRGFFLRRKLYSIRFQMLKLDAHKNILRLEFLIL